MANTDDQRLRVPSGSNKVAIPTDMEKLAEDVETLTVRRYANAADRSDRQQGRPLEDGMLSFLKDTGLYYEVKRGAWQPWNRDLQFNRAGVTDVNGYAVVAHGLPFTPRMIIPVFNPSVYPAGDANVKILGQIKVDIIDNTNFRMLIHRTDGATAHIYSQLPFDVRCWAIP